MASLCFSFKGWGDAWSEKVLDTPEQSLQNSAQQARDMITVFSFNKSQSDADSRWRHKALSWLAAVLPLFAHREFEDQLILCYFTVLTSVVLIAALLFVLLLCSPLNPTSLDGNVLKETTASRKPQNCNYTQTEWWLIGPRLCGCIVCL